MSNSYQPRTQDQAYLPPPSLRDWLLVDHLAWFILEVVSQLDLSAIEKAIESKDAQGQRPYHPSMMVALLVYAYCTGVYSSHRAEMPGGSSREYGYGLTPPDLAMTPNTPDGSSSNDTITCSR